MNPICLSESFFSQKIMKKKMQKQDAKITFWEINCGKLINNLMFMNIQ